MNSHHRRRAVYDGVLLAVLTVRRNGGLLRGFTITVLLYSAGLQPAARQP